jgi:hypothetical protein
MRDTPYLEDLGERYRDYTVTAYIANDRADIEAAALMATCAQRGPGVMVLPTIGPVLVRCLEFNRKHERDRLGFIAHEIRFVREGASGALASVASLVNMIFIQAEAAAIVVAEAFAVASFIKNVPDYVSETLQLGIENSLATFEAVRTNYVVTPEASAIQRDAIQTTYDSLQTVFSEEDEKALEEVGLSVIKVGMALVENMEPSSGLRAMERVISELPVTVSQSVGFSRWRSSVQANAQATSTLLRIAALIAYCEAVAKIKLSDRNTAITLRAKVANYFDEQMEALPSESYVLFYTMTSMRDVTVDYLSRTIIDLAPIVNVAANQSMPSLYWAWRLYKDPTRSTELAERNRVPHPSFMPPTFEALGK